MAGRPRFVHPDDLRWPEIAAGSRGLEMPFGLEATRS
jgi:hypothetical protein